MFMKVFKLDKYIKKQKYDEGRKCLDLGLKYIEQYVISDEFNINLTLQTYMISYAILTNFI